MAAERVTLCSLCIHTMRRTGEVTDEDERRRIEVQRSGKRQVTLGGVHTAPSNPGRWCVGNLDWGLGLAAALGFERMLARLGPGGQSWAVSNKSEMEPQQGLAKKARDGRCRYSSHKPRNQSLNQANGPRLHSVGIPTSRPSPVARCPPPNEIT